MSTILTWTMNILWQLSLFFMVLGVSWWPCITCDHSFLFQFFLKNCVTKFGAEGLDSRLLFTLSVGVSAAGGWQEEGGSGACQAWPFNCWEGRSGGGRGGRGEEDGWKGRRVSADCETKGENAESKWRYDGHDNIAFRVERDNYWWLFSILSNTHRHHTCAKQGTYIQSLCNAITPIIM